MKLIFVFNIVRIINYNKQLKVLFFILFNARIIEKLFTGQTKTIPKFLRSFSRRFMDKIKNIGN